MSLSEDAIDAKREQTTSEYTDRAIKHCQDSIGRHRGSILYITMLLMFLIFGLFLFLSFANSSNSSNKPSELVTYGTYLAAIGLISILFTLYKTHLKEISKAEQNIVAFFRIGIAGNEGDDHFNSAVRRALTTQAFYTEEQNVSVRSKSSKIESPIPGYITSDLITFLLNKIKEAAPAKAVRAPKPRVKKTS